MSYRLTDEEQQQAIRDALERFAKARRIPLAEVLEVWSERAAIREYVGGMRHRRNAELHAVGDTFDVFSKRRRR